MVFDEIKTLVDVETTRLVEEYKKNRESGFMETKSIITLVIGVILIAALLPTAIVALNAANTTGFSPAQLALYSLVGFIILAVVIMKISE